MQHGMSFISIKQSFPLLISFFIFQFVFLINPHTGVCSVIVSWLQVALKTSHLCFYNCLYVKISPMSLTDKKNRGLQRLGQFHSALEILEELMNIRMEIPRMEKMLNLREFMISLTHLLKT